MSLRTKKKNRKMAPAKESKTGYVCGVDFQHELVNDNAHHIELYGSVKALKHHKKCFNQCGILKVTVTAERWLVKQDFKKGLK